MTAQAGHTLVIDAPHGDELTVVSFEGEEALSRPFAFDVVVATGHDLEHLARNLLGADAMFTIAPDRDGPTRVIHGVVADVHTGLPMPARGAPRARLRITPRVALAAHRRDTRVFQDLTVPAVLATTLRAYGVELAWRVEAPQRPRTYSVQYEETDLDFMQRLLAEEGVAWFTEHDSVNDNVVERIVCVDVPTRWRPLPGELSLPFSAAAGMLTREEHATRFEAAEAVGVGAVAVRGYDLSFPLREFDAATRDPRVLQHLDEGNAEVYLHHDEGQEPDVRRSRARHRLAQARRDIERAEGASNCVRICPGAFFALIDHPTASLDRRWVPTRVTHRGRNADTEGYATGEGVRYENEFACVPAERPFPPAIPPRRILQVTETATVVGPPGEDIHVDALGRVQVRFHWDRRATRENTSCWIPVMQPWAGTGWGTQFLPRVGMEVLVTFLGGDPDRPVILGSIPSSSAPPPYSLPDNRTRSGIRTQCSPGGDGGHELLFEDLTGQERVELNSRGALHLRATNHAELVAGQGISLTTGGSVGVTAGGDHDLRVDGSVRVQAAGDRVESVRGAHFAEVGGRRGEVIAGDWSVDAGGTIALAADGDVSLEAGRTEPATFTLRSSRELSLNGGERIEIHAQTEIVLRCGESAIVITPAGVEIVAPRVTVSGESGVHAAGGAATFALGDEEAIVSARRVKLFSPDASVSLDRDAHVRGREVLLNCDDEPRPEAAADPRETPRVPLRLRVTDTALNALAHKHFHVHAGGETIKGETDGDGRVTARVLASAKAATVTVWTGAYPKGPRREWRVKLDKLAPLESPRGLKERLRNLGWYEGAVDDLADDALVQALREFQADNQIAPSGAADDATRAKLASLHGA
ncbi:MAG: type VI secretion system tip protein TssI/VgrG [Polyangiales bacterium]